jgi:DNA-binding transcriptional ArsR family regulator
MDYDVEIARLAKEFQLCQKALIALGDENRQHLVLELMKMKEPDGVRVGTIAETINLSRPAVSHHLQVLKRAGIIDVRKEGTKNYYFFNPDTKALESVVLMLQHARAIIRETNETE